MGNSKIFSKTIDMPLEIEIGSLSQLLTLDFEPLGIHGFMFDYGGTLDTKGEHWSDVIIRGYRNEGLEIPQPVFWDAYVSAERELGRNPHILPTDTFHDLLRKKIAIEFDALRADSRAAGLYAELTPEKGEHIAESLYLEARQCVEESEQVLKELSKRYPMVLVSNFYGNLNAVLQDFGIKEYFKAVIESAVVGVRKPDPQIFRLGLNALGLSPESVMTVGDSLEKDILPSRSLSTSTAQLTILSRQDSKALKR